MASEAAHASSSESGLLTTPPKCWGCNKPIDGGSAIQFADGVWHIDCFQCTTCNKVIEFDSNLLFLADGKPICPECSYCCSLCKKPIFDEAIVTVEGTYHSECFRCTNCKQRIQGKSFAKTSQGVIYCVNCYAERREKKKAARRRREHQVMEEKALPSLPPDSGTEIGRSPVLASGREGQLSPSTLPSNSSAPVIGGSRPGSAAQPVGEAARQSAVLDDSGRSSTSVQQTRRRLPPPGSVSASAQPLPAPSGKPKQGLATSSSTDFTGTSSTSPSYQHHASSAPTSPTATDNAANTHGLPPVPTSPPLDVSFDAGLEWTEDIDELERKFVRFSMRAGAQPGASGLANGLREPAAEDGRRHAQQDLAQRMRAMSNSKGPSGVIPPGLRSREGSPTDAQPGDSLGQQQQQRQTEAGTEWLQHADVTQLKEELLVNYGQLCRMEASYQKLRDLYATVVNQLLETRQVLQQERSKKNEYEGILRKYYGWVDSNPSPSFNNDSALARSPGGSSSAQQQPQQQQQQRGSAVQEAKGANGGSARAQSRHHHQQRDGPPPNIGRTLSIRRQKQAAAAAASKQAGDGNESGSDVEDAIITTMPQKATKRFLWPFGGSGSGHHVAGDDGRHDSIESEATVAGTSTSPTAGRKSLDSGTTVGSRQHYFQPSNTFRPGKCERCLEKIWTFANNTVKCKHCNVICHHRCVADFPANCPGFDRSGRSVGGHHSHHGSAVNSMPAFDPNAPFQPDKMFGRSLIEQARSEDASVPWIVRAAIGFIEEQGLTMEGVYRKSGSTMDIRAIQMNVTQISVATNGKFAGTPPIASADADVTSVTSVLKQYFRELPDPLLTFETYHLWVQAAGIGSDEEKVRVYRTISDSMPHEHSETLKYLMLHLKRIAEYQQNNKMTPNNLSVVFAPNILHMPKSNVFEEMKNMGGINQTVRFLIQHANDIWGDQHYAQYSGRKDSQDNGQDASSPSSPAVGSRVEPMPIASPAGAAEQEDLNMSHSMPSSPAFLENAGGAQHSGRQQHVAHDMSERFMASHHHSPMYHKASLDIPRDSNSKF